MSAESSDRGLVRFAEKIITLLDQGGFVATYKYAVLIGLIDLCLEQSTRDGLPPQAVTTVQLAKKVVELYWPQAESYQDSDILLQNSGRQAQILTQIRKYRDQKAPDPSATLFRATLANPEAIGRLQRKVEWTLVHMPLPKLQRVGGRLDEFIYHIGWDDDVTRAQFNTDFDNRILLVPGAGQNLVDLAGVIRPLIHRQWASMVSRLNSLPDAHLQDFLFGRDRIALTPVREPLIDLQNGRCFYCQKPTGSKPQVDHFMPWSRHPDNGIGNLVVACGKCNGRKSDHLAFAGHVERWTERLETGPALKEIAVHAKWESSLSRTTNVARSIYQNLPSDVLLWEIEKKFVPVDSGVIRRAFASLAA